LGSGTKYPNNPPVSRSGSYLFAVKVAKPKYLSPMVCLRYPLFSPGIKAHSSKPRGFIFHRGRGPDKVLRLRVFLKICPRVVKPIAIQMARKLSRQKPQDNPVKAERLSSFVSGPAPYCIPDILRPVREPIELRGPLKNIVIYTRPLALR
jgi:hypothetical protein